MCTLSLFLWLSHLMIEISKTNRSTQKLRLQGIYQSLVPTSYNQTYGRFYFQSGISASSPPTPIPVLNISALVIFRSFMDAP